MINFFIFEFECENTFFISVSNHITKLKNMLNKYYPYKIKQYHNFQIVDDFRNNKINENIVFLHNTDFIDYFNYKFKDNNIRNNFYKFNQDELNLVFQYLNKFKPINNFKTKQIKILINIVYVINHFIIYLNKHMEFCKISV